MIFGFFKSKAKKMKEAISQMEIAVESKRGESDTAAQCLREKLEATTIQLTRRSPLAGSLVWEPRT